MATLLLSDDSVTVQRLIAMTFAGHDVQVTAVSDGEDAIARIRQQRPDIVLASIKTPKRTGYEVAAFVKSMPELAGTPVLLLAAAFEPVDEVRVAQVRCDGVLVKPLDPQQVVARVTQLLQTHRVTPGTPMVQAAIAAPAPAPAQAAAPAGSVDDYFERLDAAFAQRPAVRSVTPPDDVGTVPTLDAVLQAETPASAVPAHSTVATPSATASAAPLVTDALIDEVTRRVAERLGTPMLRAVMADVVADVAERLIREEIARIRNKT